MYRTRYIVLIIAYGHIELSAKSNRTAMMYLLITSDLPCP